MGPGPVNAWMAETVAVVPENVTRAHRVVLFESVATTNSSLLGSRTASTPRLLGIPASTPLAVNVAHGVPVAVRHESVLVVEVQPMFEAAAVKMTTRESSRTSAGP